MATTTEPEVQTPSAASTTAIMQGSDATGSIAAFASHEKFRAAQRIAFALSESNMVPKPYQKNIANCLVAMELASRTGASVLMVMQNLHIIQGRPSWSAAFLVGCVNSSGRFTPIRYESKGGDNPKDAGYAVRAFAKDRETGDVLVGEWITWEMVKAEGWLNKDGSKWKTMPGQMFRYRAASFWARVYAPEISLGMQTAEEAADITPAGQPSTATQNLNQALGVGSAPQLGAGESAEQDVSDMVEADEAEQTSAL